MPSKLPRVNVTVTEEQYALLRELAELSGPSAAGFLRQMLDQVTPLLRVVLPAMRTASEEMNSAQASLDAIFAEVHALGLKVNQPDLLDLAPGGASRGSRSERGRASQDEVEQPPSSNTGVRIGRKRDQRGNKPQ